MSDKLLTEQTLELKKAMIDSKEIEVRLFKIGNEYDAVVWFSAEKGMSKVKLERMNQSDMDGLIMGLTVFGRSRGVKVGVRLAESTFAPKGIA